MKVHIVACGIFQLELERVLEEINAEWAPADEFKVTFTSPALHVDFAKLKHGVVEALDMVNEEKTVLFFGSMCHPELAEFTEKYHVIRQQPSNCIELVLGKERQKELEESARVFYITPGWLRNWQNIFRQGLGWDEIDARQNFGFYDKVLLLDTGVFEFNYEDILEFYEYTQVPIEIQSVELVEFKKHVLGTLKEALALH
ncbi:DUF1638 domain-containing protein [Desulfosporosinus sp. BICA1-9]|uniref:DUF1638 domain-containing protein n=1 Tax=Desulfosporosinus sp. BICA1-9 TaxID=1531958 RepID=UPI00054B28A3|nr:DUF1638 domain-containing protein [Desulfosporosinus sp. BICA1-9]KJS46814.1 MAG: hypothetical protein VR66_23285 [Peptococcaceae bacterium BRH_c23]KJS88236.1 MAG: hypothetical protein JL57_12330 [Desulfosporosinus sp. BICA1-9]HBW36769.1 DUF1638 domain-containing protein [Desulfosporosinus sp.]